jgi:hypothetical protein
MEQKVSASVRRMTASGSGRVNRHSRKGKGAGHTFDSQGRNKEKFWKHNTQSVATAGYAGSSMDPENFGQDEGDEQLYTTLFGLGPTYAALENDQEDTDDHGACEYSSRGVHPYNG